jgi:hypothetical protein
MRRVVSLIRWSATLAALFVCITPDLSGMRAGPAAAAPAGMAQGGAAPRQTSVILGRVVDGDTGRPVGGAVVMASVAVEGASPEAQREAALVEVGLVAPPPGGAGPPAIERRFVMSDAEGRFVMRDVPAGSYPLTAQMPGYLSASHGQYRPQGPSEPLRVAADKPVVDVTIRMWRYASISGIVLDESGEPAVDVGVRALRVTVAGGRRRLSPSIQAMTDDRGVYRIANLPPAEYVLVVPSTTTSFGVSTAEAYQAARATGGSSL